MLGAAVFYGLSQKGGAYPRGGAQMMSACLVPVVERYGGRVLCRASVQEIVVEDGKVVGVKVEGAKKMIKAKTVISSAGYRDDPKSKPKIHTLDIPQPPTDLACIA